MQATRTDIIARFMAVFIAGLGLGSLFVLPAVLIKLLVF